MLRMIFFLPRQLMLLTNMFGFIAKCKDQVEQGELEDEIEDHRLTFNEQQPPN